MEQNEDGRLRLNAQPSKRILLNAARGVSPDIAISELVDNAIDVWREKTPTRDLTVKLTFDFIDDRCAGLHVEDDGGGVEVERLTALVKAGTENPNPNAIGVWGQGLKVSCIALAEDVRIVTRPREGPPYQIDWPKEWWETDDWTLWATRLPNDSAQPGSLRIHLSKLKAPLRREELLGGSGVDGILARLGRIYAPLLSAAQSPRVILTAIVDGQARPIVGDRFGDPARWSDLFAFPPGYPPTVHETSFGRRGLKARAVVGLLPEQSRDLSGVTMYGKGRLFVQALKEGAVGFGTRGAAMIPASHPTTWRLLVLVYFEGPSEDIPWTPVTKQGYSPGNPYNKEIRAFIAGIAAPYAAFTRVAKRLDILPYSSAWSEFDAEALAREIAGFTRNAASTAEFLAAAPHLKKKWEPQQPVLAKEAGADLALPALNVAASRAIAHGLQQRNVDPRESRNPVKLWTAVSLASRPTPKAAQTENVPLAGMSPAFLESANADAEWANQSLVTVRLPRAVLRLIEAESGVPPATFIAKAAELRAAREIDPLIGLRTDHFRPILQVVRTRLLAELPDVARIGVFGSVAKGKADRQSDIDLLVLHADPLLARRKANTVFQEVRHPTIHGPRYKISLEVFDEPGFDRLGRSDDPKVKEMMTDIVWIHPLPAAGRTEVTQ